MHDQNQEIHGLEMSELDAIVAGSVGLVNLTTLDIDVRPSDHMISGDGVDRLRGGSGKDLLVGGSGDDLLLG